MGRKARHQAAPVGHTRYREYDNGIFQREVPRFYGKCSCGWTCKYSRATRAQADADTRQHIAEAA